MTVHRKILFIRYNLTIPLEITKSRICEAIFEANKYKNSVASSVNDTFISKAYNFYKAYYFSFLNSSKFLAIAVK